MQIFPLNSMDIKTYCHLYTVPICHINIHLYTKYRMSVSVKIAADSVEGGIKIVIIYFITTKVER